ncbi:LysR family transcriptional regulator [Pollutimonas bauzanensis]|uniref:LysR family transcriptional regulator n=1 Tax=Pollutimonas bauzanensis TaxID=658167 RepID=UPI00333E731C
MLNLTRLRLLNELTTLGTITAVARARGTTRPAVSQQLALLEKEVGSTLFERTSSGIRMTTEGERLSSRIGALFDMVEDIEAELASSSDVVVGQVRLSAFGSFSTGIVPTAFSILRQLHPRLTLMFTEYASQDGIRAVVAREIDIAIIDEWADIQRPARSLEISTLGTDDFVAVVSREHPLANRKTIHLADLADDMWAINQGAAPYRSILLNACFTAGFTPKEVCNCRNVSAIIEFIKKIGLVSVLPSLSLQPFLDDDQIRLIALSPSLSREIRVVTLPGALKRRSLNAIVQTLGDVTKGRR